MKTLTMVAIAICGGLFWAACGSDDDGGGGSGTCAAVCECVVANGGDNDICQQECAASISAGGNVKASCEAKLDAYQIPQCKSKCVGFSSGG